MNYLKKACLIPLLMFGVSVTTQAQNLETKFDKMLNKQYPNEGPGATALVAINGEIIYHKGFGLANMELQVPMEADMILEIGSITKQFTAVSILMLMEQGSLSLNDEITRFIKDYPTQGHRITIHHLLTHTSGIRSYTSMNSLSSIIRKDLTPEALINYFKEEPMDFAPGEQYKYNNSAFIILGHIIEVISGQTYEQFIETNIFQPLGMTSSMYGSHTEIIKKRASGYQKKEEYRNAEYISLTLPYAAGSIMSTVEDLFIWNRAIRSNKLVKKESIDLAFTNYELNNGDKINYGYGWGLGTIKGSPTIQHSGSILGFNTSSIYLPDEDVFVAVFSNCNCNPPQLVSIKMAAQAIEKPYPDETDIISLEVEYLEKLVGTYTFDDGATRTITLEKEQLYSQRIGGNKIKLFPFAKDTFFFESDLASIQFLENGDKTEAVYSKGSDNIKGRKTTAASPKQKEIQVSDEILSRYVGVYELTPNFSLTISLENGKLMSQATGQASREISAESETMFFRKGTEARIEFIKNENGQYDSLIIYQSGRKIPAKRKNQ